MDRHFKRPFPPLPPPAHLPSLPLHAPGSSPARRHGGGGSLTQAAQAAGRRQLAQRAGGGDWAASVVGRGPALAPAEWSALTPTPRAAGSRCGGPTTARMYPNLLQLREELWTFAQ